MDWRDRVRRAVNRADYVGPWRLAVPRVVDPMEWYMRSHDEDNVRPHRPQPRRSEGVGWTSYAPLGNAPPDRESRHVQACEVKKLDRGPRSGAGGWDSWLFSPVGAGSDPHLIVEPGPVDMAGTGTPSDKRPIGGSPSPHGRREFR